MGDNDKRSEFSSELIDRRRFLQASIGVSTVSTIGGCSTQRTGGDGSTSNDPCNLPSDELASKFKDWYSECPNKWYSQVNDYIQDLGSVWKTNSPEWDAETLIHTATDIIVPGVDDVFASDAASAMKSLLEATTESFHILSQSWVFLDTMDYRSQWNAKINSNPTAQARYEFLRKNTVISMSREYSYENAHYIMDYAILPLFVIGGKTVPPKDNRDETTLLAKIQDILQLILPTISPQGDFEQALHQNLRNYKETVDLLLAIYQSNGESEETKTPSPTPASSKETMSASWPMVSHDYRNTGFSDTTGLTKTVREKWTFSTGNYESWATPIIANGTVYVGSDEQNLYALSVSSGTERWRQSGIASNPAVENGVVYAGTVDGELIALDGHDGAHQWSFSKGGPIYAPTSFEGKIFFGTANGMVYAVSASDGSELWEFSTDNDLPIFTAPAVSADNIFVASNDGNVYALSISNGEEEWCFETGGRAYSSPAVADETVYAGGESHTVYALSSEDGTEYWRYQTDGNVSGSPAIGPNNVYFGSWDYHLYAISRKGGNEQWKTKTEWRKHTSPALADGVVHLGAGDNNIYGISTADGSILWKKYIGNQCECGFSSPAVVDGIIYVGNMAFTGVD